MDDIVTVSEAAKFLGRHPDTIRRWIETKLLKARHISAGSHGIFVMLRTDLLELLVSDTLKNMRKVQKKASRKPPQIQKELPLE